MTDEECLRVFSEIEAALRDLGVGWVVQQVDELLAVGRVTNVQVSTSAAPLEAVQQLALTDAERAGRRGGRKAEFAKAIDFSPCETLTILIDAVEQAFCQTARMQVEADGTVREILGAAGIELIDPATGAATPLTIEDARQTSTATLNELIRNLRGELTDVN